MLYIKTHVEGVMELEKICELGRAVIEIEAKMVNSLLSRIDHQFAKACLFLMNNPTYRKKLSENAVKFVEEFSVSRTAERLSNLYEKLIYQYNIERYEN